MIYFELNAKTNLMTVSRDNKVLNIFPFSDANQACIVYLKNVLYKTIKKMIEERKNAYSNGYIIPDKIDWCRYYLERLDESYSKSDYIKRIDYMLKFELSEITPPINSPFFKNFIARRDELIAIIQYYTSGKPMYKIVNQVEQKKIDFSY